MINTCVHCCNSSAILSIMLILVLYYCMDKVAVYLQSLLCHCAIGALLFFISNVMQNDVLFKHYGKHHISVYLQSLPCYCAVPIPR